MSLSKVRRSRYWCFRAGLHRFDDFEKAGHNEHIGKAQRLARYKRYSCRSSWHGVFLAQKHGYEDGVRLCGYIAFGASLGSEIRA